MPSISVSGILRKVRRFWFSHEDSLELDASPTASRIPAKVDQHAQSGPATPGLACMGMIRCKSTDKRKLAHVGGFHKQVQPSARKPGLAGGRKVVQVSPAAEAMALPSRSAGTKAAIGAIRMNAVAARHRRKANEVSLWKRRMQAELPQLQID